MDKLISEACNGLLVLSAKVGLGGGVYLFWGHQGKVTSLEVLCGHLGSNFWTFAPCDKKSWHRSGLAKTVSQEKSSRW